MDAFMDAWRSGTTFWLLFMRVIMRSHLWRIRGIADREAEIKNLLKFTPFIGDNEGPRVSVFIGEGP